MRYRWDPAYPMGRRDTQDYDARLRASDDERNAVADKLSRHYAEGRLDEVEFKNRLDTAMSATTRGDLNGLFDDLPRLQQRARATAAAAPPGPALDPRRGRRRHRRRARPCPFFPLYHVPWLLFAIVGFFVWRRAGGHVGGPHHHHMHHHHDGRAPQLGHGPLSRRRAHIAHLRRTDRSRAPTRPAAHPAQPVPGDGRRPGHAAVPGALRRPPRRRNRGDRRPLRRLHRPSRAGGPGAGRARPDVARHHGRARRRAARRHADRAAREG